MACGGSACCELFIQQSVQYFKDIVQKKSYGISTSRQIYDFVSWWKNHEVILCIQAAKHIANAIAFRRAFKTFWKGSPENWYCPTVMLTACSELLEKGGAEICSTSFHLNVLIVYWKPLIPINWPSPIWEQLQKMTRQPSWLCHHLDEMNYTFHHFQLLVIDKAQPI